jgi:hypothetical protein
MGEFGVQDGESEVAKDHVEIVRQKDVSEMGIRPHHLFGVQVRQSLCNLNGPSDSRIKGNGFVGCQVGPEVSIVQPGQQNVLGTRLYAIIGKYSRV